MSGGFSVSFAPVGNRLLAMAIAVPLLALTIEPIAASASEKAASASPGRFSGYGFDTCAAPSQSVMNELRRESPFWGVGIYIGGAERSCRQPNLDRSWVRTQRAKGWKLFPIWVDRQSACADNQSLDTLIAKGIKKAEQQGFASADRAVRSAKRLGIARGSTLFLDIESWDTDDIDCNRSVFNYMSSWNHRLRAVGYKGGFYSAAATGINRLDYVRANNPPDTFTWPTSVWIAHGDGRANTSSPYLRDSYYRHQRVKQYELDTTRTFGSVTLDLDLNAIDFGGGAVAPRKRPSCGVKIDFASYRPLHRGQRGGQVAAAQCLLEQKGYYGGKVSGQFDRATDRAVGRLQADFGLRRTGELTKATWTTLHAAGSPTLLKRGSVSDRVRGLQRALTAALNKRVTPSGIFGAPTTGAVRAYQRSVGLPANGIVGTSTWKALKSGERPDPG